LGAVLILVGGKLEPARRLTRIVRAAAAIEEHAAEPILRVGIAEIGRRIEEHAPRPPGVRLGLGVRNAAEVILPERYERVGDDASLRRVRAVLGVHVGDLAEIFERAKVAARHALTGGVHAPELPLRERDALLGG